MKQSVQDPLNEDSPVFENQEPAQDLSDFLLYQSLQEIQMLASFHLVNVIYLTQDTKVQKSLITIWQNSQIDTSSLVPKKGEIVMTESSYGHKQDISQQKIPHFAATQPSFTLSQLSKSVNYGLAKCSFQLLVKKQQEKQKQNMQQPSFIPKQHKCNFQESIKKRNPPIKYRSVSSHYSPQRLELYLNKNEPGLQENKKWLKNKSYVPATLQLSSRMTDQELKNNFKRNSSIASSIAVRHHTLASSFK